MSKTSEMAFDESITSMERSAGSLGETLTVTSGKKVFFIDAHSRAVRKEHALALPPSSASLHPTMADRFIAGCTSDGWVRIFDYEMGAERELHKGHHGPAHAVSYSPDGELAASGSEDGEQQPSRTSANRSHVASRSTFLTYACSSLSTSQVPLDCGKLGLVASMGCGHSGRPKQISALGGHSAKQKRRLRCKDGAARRCARERGK